MRWLALLALLLTVLVALPPREARADRDEDYPTVEEFIAVVRGYDIATIRRTFPAYNTGVFERIFGAGTPIPLTTDREGTIFAEQLVRTPAGLVLDIGHVVTGLEAAAPLPPVARALEMMSGCQMRASVIWSGDVGEALLFFAASGQSDPAPFYERSAPLEDLYGNIDGFVFGAEFGGPSIDTADVLTRMYLQSDYESQRFSRFVAALGDNAEEFAARQIVCFARSYAALTSTPVDPARLMEAAPYFVDRFWSFVTAGVEAETAGTSR